MPDFQQLKKNYNLTEIVNKNDKTRITSVEPNNIYYENQLLFNKITDILRHDFCSNQELTSNYENHDFCFQKCLNFHEVEKMLTNYRFKKNEWMNLSKHLPILLSEYENDLERNRKDIVYNIIKINRPICSYATAKLCCQNWVRKTGFKFKSKEKYIDYNKFVSAWLDIMNKMYGSSFVRVRGTNLI
ncbi:MAG: hypothetical protein WBB67_12180 [bacterium]